MAGIWVFAETVDGTPTPVVLELLTKARSLGETTAIALGPSASKAVETLGKYGAKKVYIHEDPAFRDILATPAVDLLARLIEKAQPDLVIFGMTYAGRDVASRLSARLSTALIAGCTVLLSGPLVLLLPVASRAADDPGYTVRPQRARLEAATDEQGTAMA